MCICGGDCRCCLFCCGCSAWSSLVDASALAGGVLDDVDLRLRVGLLEVDVCRCLRLTGLVL